jgi:hypothetical protein
VLMPAWEGRMPYCMSIIRVIKGAPLKKRRSGFRATPAHHRETLMNNTCLFDASPSAFNENFDASPSQRREKKGL